MYCYCQLANLPFCRFCKVQVCLVTEILNTTPHRAGKRLIQSSKVLIFGRDVFRNPYPGVTFLGTEWAMNPVVRGDIVVSHFLDSVGGYRHKERRDKLLDILDVDLDWHMHQISDGERRRVQLVMGLMMPWEVLLLDEVGPPSNFHPTSKFGTRLTNDLGHRRSRRPRQR